MKVLFFSIKKLSTIRQIKTFNVLRVPRNSNRRTIYRRIRNPTIEAFSVDTARPHFTEKQTYATTKSPYMRRTNNSSVMTPPPLLTKLLSHKQLIAYISSQEIEEKGIIMRVK
jgi:hypothetical protein